MKLHELKSPDGTRTRRKRVGRGTGSGHGKTSGRGQKGQHARSQGFRLGFEGGQMPLAQRLPKLGGFKNPFKKVFALVNLSKLSRFGEGAVIDPERLAGAGLVDPGLPVKILGAGKLTRRVDVTAHAVSESARAAIEKRGGTVTLLVAEPMPESGKPTRRGAGPAGSPDGARAEEAPEQPTG